MLQSTSELRTVKLFLVNIQPSLCQYIPALGVWSFHARSRIHPDRCRRVRFDVDVDSTQHSSCWLAVDAESPRSRIVNSSLSGASSRAKPAPALSWPDLRCLHHSLICSPLESLVTISTSFSVPFIFLNTSFVTFTSLLDRFFKILAVLDVGVRACTLFSECRRLQQAVLDLPSTRLLAFCCPPSDPSRTVRARMLPACCCLALLTTTNCLSISSRRSIFSGSPSMMSSPWIGAIVSISRQ